MIEYFLSEILFRNLVNEYSEIEDSYTGRDGAILNELCDLSAIKDRSTVCLTQYMVINNSVIEKSETTDAENRVAEKEKRKEKPERAGRA